METYTKIQNYVNMIKWWFVRRGGGRARGQRDAAHAAVRRGHVAAAGGLPAHHLRGARLGDAAQAAQQEEDHWPEVCISLQ